MHIQRRPPGSRPVNFAFIPSLPLLIAMVVAAVCMGGNSTAQTTTILHRFTGLGGDGFNPVAPLIADSNGSLYGTTYTGGDLNCTLAYGGCGVVFQLTPSSAQWTYSTIHKFNGVTDGCCQSSALSEDRLGRIYGVTTGGSFGKLFRMAPTTTGKWNFQILYTFQNGSDGEYPLTPLSIGESGAIYGVTPSGSLTSCPNGCGAVFQVLPPAIKGGSWTENTLYQFTGASDGWLPTTMIHDRHGVIYGTTNFGGTVNGRCPSGCGVVFQLMPSQTGQWTFSAIYTFDGQPDGNPYSSLFEDASGALYGLAFQINAGGEIFKLTPPSSQGGSWTRSIAYVPKGGITYLTEGLKGVLYGVETGDMDINAGSLFRLTPQAGGGYAFKQIVNFNQGPDRNPNAVLLGPSGVLYETLSGGSSDGGMVVSVR